MAPKKWTDVRPGIVADLGPRCWLRRPSAPRATSTRTALPSAGRPLGPTSDSAAS